MQTFTFRADRALSSVRTVEAPPWAQGRPAGLGRLARCPDWPRGGRPGAAQGPEHGRTAPMAAPRCTMLAEVMLHDRDTLSHAEKRDGSDHWVVRAGSSKLGEGRSACSSHVHPLASQGRRRPGCNMRMAVRGRAHTCMAGLVAVLDREDTAGTMAAPPRCGRSKTQHVPRPAQRV